MSKQDPGQLGSQVFYDEDTSVKYMVHGSNQWISFDDSESFQAKVKFMTSLCLRGLAIWSIDQDTAFFNASAALFGEKALESAVLEDELDERERAALIQDLSAYTGQNCYVTSFCEKAGETSDSSQKCSAGYSSVGLAHNPNGIGEPRGIGFQICDEDSWHHVCCPTRQGPQNCEWVGGANTTNAVLAAFHLCNGTCGETQFELTRDSSLDFKGEQKCLTGHRSVRLSFTTECLVLKSTNSIRSADVLRWSGDFANMPLE